MKKIPSTTVILFALALFANAQNTNSVRSIDTYVKTIKKLSLGNDRHKIIFADTADPEQTKSKWKRFGSEKALEKFREKSETYSIAYCWKQGGKFVGVNFTDFSPSADWANYTFHYFRPDGTLAKVESEMRTFMGDYIVQTNFYFNRSGRRIGKTRKYLDLTTKKPKEPTPEMKDENNSMFGFDYFKTTKKLPFARIAGIK
ncbi:MAG: hypothetical protein IPG67_03270 [Acidobacteria bacterium]|nr:hypothetical protein [Acidobacteriota bacterium]